MTRTDFGILGAYNKYRKSPFETYYMGGDGMSGYSSSYANDVIGLRGYENGSIAGNFAGTRNNAYAYSRLTLELRYPLMLETATSIYALAFAEAGNAWSDVNRMNPFKLKTSAGVGVRILLPMIGLMGIDWAYGFKRPSWDRISAEANSTSSSDRNSDHTHLRRYATTKSGIDSIFGVDAASLFLIEANLRLSCRSSGTKGSS